MGYLRQDWSHDVLILLGNIHPTSNVVKWVSAWTLCEVSPPDKAKEIQPQFNLLNTSYPLPGSSDASRLGAQHYLTYGDGIAAAANTLSDGLYPETLAALSLGDEYQLGFATGVINPVIAAELERWSGGKGYSAKLFSQIGKNLSDVFVGENTFGRELQAQKIWNSTAPLLFSSYGGVASTSNAVYLKWREVFLAGKHVGPPITLMYPGNDEETIPVIFQEFTNCHAELGQDGIAHLYTLESEIAPVIPVREIHMDIAERDTSGSMNVTKTKPKGK